MGKNRSKWVKTGQNGQKQLQIGQKQLELGNFAQKSPFLAMQMGKNS